MTKDAEIARVCRVIAEDADYSLTEFQVAEAASEVLDMPPRDVRLAWQRVRDQRS